MNVEAQKCSAIAVDWGQTQDFNVSSVHNTSTWGIHDARAEKKQQIMKIEFMRCKSHVDFQQTLSDHHRRSVGGLDCVQMRSIMFLENMIHTWLLWRTIGSRRVLVVYLHVRWTQAGYILLLK